MGHVALSLLGNITRSATFVNGISVNWCVVLIIGFSVNSVSVFVNTVEYCFAGTSGLH